jgi:hypothetical protein
LPALLPDLLKFPTHLLKLGAVLVRRFKFSEPTKLLLRRRHGRVKGALVVYIRFTLRQIVYLPLKHIGVCRRHSVTF